MTNFGIPDLCFSGLSPMGGASPVAAVQIAEAVIAAGICNHVLIPAGRNVSSGARAGVRIHQMPQFHLVTEYELPQGAIAPAQLYAPMARRHMELYGTTSRQLGEIAVSTRANALRHPNAIMKTPITIEDHQASRMIADPFRLLDCSLDIDGAPPSWSVRPNGRATCRIPASRCWAWRRATRIPPPPSHPAFKGELPYVLVTVDLPEGPRVLGRFARGPDTTLRLGLPVRVSFPRNEAGTPLPLWTAVES